MIPDNESRKRPLLSEEDNPQKSKQSGGQTDEAHDPPGFFPHLSKLAFAQVIKSNVFLPKLNAMRIPITLHITQKKADHIAFLDCGATECFISQRFIDEHQLGVHLMENPWKLQNANGSPNAGGGLKHFTELKVITGETPHLLCFYITDMGLDDLVLGYPWFVVMNAHPNWMTSTLPASIIIRTKGVASGKPMHSVWVAGMRTTIQNQPLLKVREELYLCIMKIDPTCAAKTTIAQQLAEQAADKTIHTWDQIVPAHYHEHAKVFSEEAAHQFPESRKWDHAINLKPSAPNMMDCKVYPLSPTEDIALQKFIAKNLEKGYIHQSKSPYAFPFFFIKKKNGDL